MYDDSNSKSNQSTITVNVGTPGKIRSISLAAGPDVTVAEALSAAEISVEGYDIRVDGKPSTVSSRIFDQQTVLLITPVLGNFETPTTISVNVGTPGQIRPIRLDAALTWTVAQVLNVAEIPVEGYDVRVDGLPSIGDLIVSDGQTILLITPVLGN